MKTRFNPFLSAAITLALVSGSHAADFIWDGGTGNWSDMTWNGATATGPTTAGNIATINGGTVTVNTGVGGVDSITIATGAQLNFSNSNPFYAYNGVSNLILQGGTVNGLSTDGNYGASFFGGLTVNGSAASTISGVFFNLGPSAATFNVADVTGDANPDLNVNAGLWDLPGYGSPLIKEGSGTMTMASVNVYTGGTTVNAGTLELAGASGGVSRIKGAITVNAGATLLLSGGDGTGLGYQGFYKATALTINGGTVTSANTAHLFDFSPGISMTGGTLETTSGSFQLKGTNINTSASPNTATIAGAINLRSDFGAFNQAVDVADGAAATDLLISANITQAGANLAGITKTGAGTLQLSGTNTYAGTTTVSGGTLVLSGAGNYTGTLQVDAGSTLSLSNAVIDDGAPVVIANGGTVNVNFVGSDTVGSLEIDGSGPLPAGTYSATQGDYQSYFSGAGSLVVLAQDGTWTSTSDGNWSDSSKWTGSIIAVGANNTATFNAANDVTVTLDSNRIIGNLAFNLSNYVLDGGTTLTLDTDSTTPVISVGSGLSATLSAGLGGNDGMEKTGAGALVLNGVKAYNGGTTVTAGTLELASTTLDQSAVRGSVTVASGATLKLAGADFTGLGRLGATVTTLEVDGGTVENTVQSWVSGAAVNLTGSTMSGAGNYHVISSGFNSIASTTTSTISSNLVIRKDYGSADLSFDVGNGDAATDLLISGNIAQVFAVGVVKNGEGKLLLAGTNTYTGNTLVNDGTLEVSSASGLRFSPTTTGVTNSVTGTSTASLNFQGTVDLDLGAAVAAGGNTWNLFNLGSFSGPTPVLTPIAVTSTLGSFTEVSSGTWELPATSAKWVFTEADGNLAYVVTATPYETWGSTYGLTAGSEGGDLDNDGLTNFEEYSFGLIPNSGSSVNALVVPFNPSTGTLSYTRRTQSLTGLDYSVWYSTDLSVWTEDTGAVEGTISVSGDVETVPVTLSNALLSNTKLFIQVRAQ